MSVVFCKQKTAYEMRISDWSSDVCSSDLMLLAVPCDDGHGAHTDLVDCASAAADHDDIAGLDRSVHQQNDPGDEISECLLQTKADGQTGRARENRKCGKIDTRYVDADKKGDNDD